MASINPCTFIKKHVFPKGMTVTEAAKILGIARPTLSKILNGRASLSQQMIKTISKAFDYPIDEILEVNNSWLNNQIKENSVDKLPLRYVPKLFNIKASELNNWANSCIEIRHRFPVLIRTLIHSSNTPISSISFPGNEHSQDPGFDGFVSSQSANAWIPLGNSYWELGTNKNTNSKANDDFNNSLKKLSQSERLKSTFVFVTPRNWPQKKKWEEKVNALHEWGRVLAYDAETLEEWLEQSLAGQVWLADELKFPYTEISSLTSYWSRWANVTQPSLSPKIYTSAIQKLKTEIQEYFNNKKNTYPLHIKTFNVDEALAMLALVCKDTLLINGKIPVVLNSQNGASKLFGCNLNVFPIIHKEEIVEEFADYLRQIPSIVLCSPESFEEAYSRVPYIELPKVDAIDFERGLDDMDFSDSEISRYRQTTGQNIAALRRILSPIKNLSTPRWFHEKIYYNILLALYFVGKWRVNNKADQNIISYLAYGRPYEQIESDVRKFTQITDTPCWIGKNFGKVISKEEVLFTVIKKNISNDLIHKLSKISEKLISSLVDENPEEKYSNDLINGFFSSLALLSDNQSEIIPDDIQFSFNELLEKIIDLVLPSPLKKNHLIKVDSILGLITEIQPHLTIKTIKSELFAGNDALLELIEPSKDIFTKPTYLGLLESLEKLAWIRTTARDAILILAKISTKKLPENCTSPSLSLKYIFDPIYPQTSLSLDELLLIFKEIKKNYPEIAWELCLSIMRCTGSQLTHVPVWIRGSFRSLFTTSGKERFNYCDAIFRESLHWERYSAEQINALIDLFSRFEDKKCITQLWDLIDEWKDVAKESEKSKVREKIRNIYFSQQLINLKLSKKGNQIYRSLVSNDLYRENIWLFKHYCPDIKVSNKKLEFGERIKKQEHIVQTMRVEILSKLIEMDGLSAITRLLSYSPTELTASLIAQTISKIFNEKQLVSFSIDFIEQAKNFSDNVVLSMTRSLLWSQKNALISYLSYPTKHSQSNLSSFVLNAPFVPTTWHFVSEISGEFQKQYWENVKINDAIADSDIGFVLSRLLDVQRLNECLSLIEYRYRTIPIRLQYEILVKSAFNTKDRYVNHSFSVREILRFILNSPELSIEEKAILEAYYCHSIVNPFFHEKNEIGLRNIEKIIETKPLLFALLSTPVTNESENLFISFFKNNEFAIDAFSKNAHYIQMGLKHIPGSDQNNYQINTAKTKRWIEEALVSATSEDNSKILQSNIGELLSHCPQDLTDGLWPNHAICDVLETFKLEFIAIGLVHHFSNSRGIRWVGEKTVAEDKKNIRKYEDLAQQWCIRYPFVSEYIFSPIASSFKVAEKFDRQNLEEIENY